MKQNRVHHAAFALTGLLGCTSVFSYSNTVALYHFEEAGGDIVRDASRNGNHRIAIGTTITDGRFGKARGFNDSLGTPT